MSADPALSIVVPMRNEAGNVGPLLAEIEAACASSGTFEVIVVDDGSADATAAELAASLAARPWLTVLRHRASGGQSAAIRTGILAARAPVIATLDGDGQNDPRFLPALVAALDGEGVGLAQGRRVGRRDTPLKILQSRVANGVRGRILRDGARDTGCGLKAFPKDVYLSLPYFDALHRFMPALVAREGHRIVHVDVIDRPRRSGRSNYGLFDRLWVGILDLAGVWWLIRRRRPRPPVETVAPPHGKAPC